ncbi:MAG: hypothetical protein ACLFTV_12185 [Desulfococcaceae bacterium]
MLDPKQMNKLVEENPLLRNNPLLKMMDQSNLLKQMTDLQQTAINSSFNAVEVMQTRLEKVMRMFWDQTAWNSDRLGGVLLDWTKAYQDGCEAAQRALETQMNQMGCSVAKPVK